MPCRTGLVVLELPIKRPLRVARIEARHIQDLVVLASLAEYISFLIISALARLFLAFMFSCP